MTSAKPTVARTNSVSLERIFAALRKRLPKARHEEAIAFTAAFYERMTEAEYALHPPEGWAALASDFLDFARKRKAGTASVRMFNTGPKHGWESPHTVLQLVNEDMPFLVDSVTMALSERGIGVHVLGHPVVAFVRDRAGKLDRVGEGDGESLMHLEIDRQSPEAMPEIEGRIAEVLGDVRAIVRDWAAMREKLLEIAEDIAERKMPVSEAGRREAEEFLHWAADDHFTFLGFREYRVVRRGGEEMLEADTDTGLGLLRGQDAGRPRPLKSLAAHYMQHSGSVDALILTKTNARATVHRPGYMDYIGILKFDDAGKPVAEQRFLGLYTSSAYNRRPWDIPLVRDRFEYVMRQSGLAPVGHSGKALRHILESLPRDELFQSNEEELYRTAVGILGLQERVRSKLFLRRDRYGRFFSVLAYIPRDRFNTDVRRRIEAMLMRALRGEHIDTTVQVGESPLAQLHLIVRPSPGEVVEVDEDALDAELTQIVRNWQDDLRDALVGQHGEERGLQLASHYGRALPTGYIEAASPASAAADVAHLDALEDPADLRIAFATAPVAADGTTRYQVKLYRQNHSLPLSDVLPMMENMGLRVVTEYPHRVEGAEGTAFIQDFRVESSAGMPLDVEANEPQFVEAFARVWNGDAESDGFNQLILAAGLGWRQVAMLRGYSKYLQQIGVPFSQSYVEETFARSPMLARLVVELFEARFHPGTGKETKAQVADGQALLRAQIEAIADGDETLLAAVAPVVEARGGARERQVGATRHALLALLDRVSSLDEDRILRSYIDVIDATLRTSYYQADEDGNLRPYIAFKFDSAQVPELPKPRPYREIFVYGPRVEGVHLRFGPVARGGLRWSDRREDFRTEVLGLVKAQMVKNTVIVPVGAKGGFFAKRLPAGGDRDAILAEGIASYRTFINGLLEITDNLVDGEVVPPRDVVRHDGDDPYLVVAADKGTATFSDIANEIAAEHGFWMGDAFASGGSVGYDHKGMGITAKGAWESVKRHFRAMGRDSQKQDFTVVGIGDMSGDVFGNGMLLSKHIRLVAAFDHRHIFLDPDPDAARSFKERQRLFKLPRSSWEDYDKSLISEGGGVFPRSAKSIALNTEIRDALGLEESVGALSPAELMKAILKAPVDLLWNGGIGTYVKGSGESHAEVGDRANNALRVDGRELRSKVVAEGGNLGLTQLGRIEAAQHGVLLNTDFIDNSAGVDTSDHEVNIKILLNGQVQEKKLTLAARNKLLVEMTDEVEALVLNDNYRQNQAISLMERMSVARLGSKQHFIRTLESQGLLDRQLEFLPSDAELSERKARGQGLTRPELAVLLSYAKLVLYQQLLESHVPEDPYLSKELVRYFPEPLQKKYAKAAEQHRLKREIIASAVTNSMVNRMGATFTLRMSEDTGRTAAEIAEAYTIAREALDARALWAQIDALDGKLPEEVQIDALQTIWVLLRAMSRWLLSRPGPMPEIAPAVARYAPGLTAIREALPGALSGNHRAAYERRLRGWRDRGVPSSLAAQLAGLPLLDAGCDIVELGIAHKIKPDEVAQVYYAFGDAMHVPWLLEQIDTLPVDGRWHAHARGVLRDELRAKQRELVGQVLATCAKTAPADRVPEWLDREDPALRFTQAMLADLRSQKSLDYPTASVAVRRLAQMAAAGEE